MMFFKQIERAMVEMINLHYNPTPEEAITYEKFILHNGHGWFWESEDYEHPTHASVAMQLIDEGDLAEEELDDCVMGRNYGDFIYAYTFYLSPEESKDEIRVFYDLPVEIEGADELDSASMHINSDNIPSYNEEKSENNVTLGYKYESEQNFNSGYPDRDYVFEDNQDFWKNQKDSSICSDAFKISIIHFQKFAERSDVERKADKIYNSGGVEFVVATPDEERQRTLWEFNVTSTTGQTYPLYGDTTMENPTRWIDWFDVACSCDWGRWNYDRAPEYRHLERFPCSHSMATEKWLSQNGMREQERARRENQTQRPAPAPAPAPTPVAQPAPSAIRQPIGLPPAQQGTNDAPAAPAARQAPSPEPAPPPPEPTVVRPVFRDQVLRPRTPLET